MAKNSELQTLMFAAETAKQCGATDMDHMDAPAAAFNYIRVADMVARYVRNREVSLPVLDWGCGYGQVTWLLRRRGIEVFSCDVQGRDAQQALSEFSPMKIDYLADPVRLPYRSDSFGAVLSVGVLEHVEDERRSLSEVHRVLKKGGRLFIYMFPNRWSWAEWIADRRRISVHPKKYTFKTSKELLACMGFVIERQWRRNLFPRNLTGLGKRTKMLYGRYYRQIEVLDSALANYSPAGVFSGVLEMVARKAP